MIPNIIIPIIAASLAMVKTFWNRAPDLTSMILSIVRRMIVKTAIPLIISVHNGKKYPRYSAKATPIAAIDAVLITVIADHPYKNPHNGPYASFR